MNPTKKTNGAVLKPTKSGVIVRMYNTGFGDCFLLAFRAEDGTACYMLLDCGVHHKYPGGEERMQLIARDIAASTDGHLDIVAITHEHTDHLYGFRYARDIFNNIGIGNLWLAWTEDPSDNVAQNLKRLKERQIQALTASINRLRPTRESLANSLQGVLNFELLDAAAAGGKPTELDYLRQKN